MQLRKTMAGRHFGTVSSWSNKGAFVYLQARFSSCLGGELSRFIETFQVVCYFSFD